LSVILTQKNVIHTADSTEEALESLKEIIGDKFDFMQKKGNLPAELWDIFKD
jgi:predicted RNase H-like HicB family nuclease